MDNFFRAQTNVLNQIYSGAEPRGVAKRDVLDMIDTLTDGTQVHYTQIAIPDTSIVIQHVTKIVHGDVVITADGKITIGEHVEVIVSGYEWEMFAMAPGLRGCVVFREE